MTTAVGFSILAGSFTFLGTALVLWVGHPSSRWIAASLGMSAGVMLFMALFELVPSALSIRPSWNHVGAGMGLGLLLMALIHRLIGEEEIPEGQESFRRLGRVLVAAILAHNLPEGAAIGVGFGVEAKLGFTLALATAVHNLPEGMGLAAPLLAAGLKIHRIAWISLVTGGALPLGTWAGIHFLTGSPDLIALGLLFAATTMIWLVTLEVLPRAVAIGKTSAWAGMILGLFLSLTIHFLHG